MQKNVLKGLKIQLKNTQERRNKIHNVLHKNQDGARENLAGTLVVVPRI